jgi:hypothetical protein
MLRNGTVLAIMAAICSSLPARSAPDPEPRKEVLEAVDTFFRTMTACDPDRARTVLHPEGRFFRVRQGPTGPRLTHSDNIEYLERLGACEETRVERIWEATVHVHGDMAAVWAPYDFWRDGAFSHCGVDLFQLVRVEGRWQIVGGAYTAETDQCHPSPLGPPSGSEPQ